MKKDKTVDFENDWKLVTLFIGGNDLCAFCKDEVTILSNSSSFDKYQGGWLPAEFLVYTIPIAVILQ